jgi:hypothetical protein
MSALPLGSGLQFFFGFPANTKFLPVSAPPGGLLHILYFIWHYTVSGFLLPRQPGLFSASRPGLETDYRQPGRMFWACWTDQHTVLPPRLHWPQGPSLMALRLNNCGILEKKKMFVQNSVLNYWLVPVRHEVGAELMDIYYHKRLHFEMCTGLKLGTRLLFYWLKSKSKHWSWLGG